MDRDGKMYKKGFLKSAFKAVATATAASMLAGSLMFGATLASAQNKDAEKVKISEIYKHETLASDSTEPVGIQLVLALDTSGSMSEEEFSIELQATADALNSEIVRNVIKYKTGDKSIAVAVVDFDDVAEVRIKWVDIRAKDINDKPYQPGAKRSSDKPDKLDKLAMEIVTMTRRGIGGTSINTALDLSGKLFLASPWKVTERRVVDVFGDGSSFGGNLQASRDNLAALGVTINGFAIINEETDLDEYFRRNLVTQAFTLGPDGIKSEPGRVWAVARNLQASNNDIAGLSAFFGEVARGMRQKISVEVAGLENYRYALVRLNVVPDFPLPEPG